jgi:hypothetical protein
MAGGLSIARLRRLGAGATAGALVGLAIAAAAVIRPDLLERAELRAYDVQDEYQRRHPKLDFTHIDAIERAEIEPEELVEFVDRGRLVAGGSR